jgi:hypothetical protein
MNTANLHYVYIFIKLKSLELGGVMLACCYIHGPTLGVRRNPRAFLVVHIRFPSMVKECCISTLPSVWNRTVFTLFRALCSGISVRDSGIFGERETLMSAVTAVEYEELEKHTHTSLYFDFIKSKNCPRWFSCCFDGHSSSGIAAGIINWLQSIKRLIITWNTKPTHAFQRCLHQALKLRIVK